VPQLNLAQPKAVSYSEPITAQRYRSELEEKNILEDLFSSVLSQKKNHPPGNPKFSYLGIFQSLKLLTPIEKVLSISLKLNSTPNILGCYGLICSHFFLSSYLFHVRTFPDNSLLSSFSLFRRLFDSSRQRSFTNLN